MRETPSVLLEIRQRGQTRKVYKLGAAELGTDSKSFSLGLQNHMTQCTNLGAFLLIDEADIFLEARNTQDPKRSAIVGEFLQKIEYHKGILFLTANGIGDLDEALYSRIDFSLTYNNLTSEGRGQVWRNFLNRSNVENFDISALSKLQLNGRQMKKTVNLASALAVHKEVSLTQEHLEIALKSQGHKSDQSTESVDID